MVNFMFGESMWIIVIYAATVRILELALAERNRRALFQAGGREFGAEHYKFFFFLHFGWFCSWIIEGSLRGGLTEGWYLWLFGFFVAQLLKFWAIFTLGERWNTRIIVIPGRALIKKGPYRFLRHPNYLAVAAELFFVPMIFGAWVSALIFTVLNAGLLLGVRIPAEEKAMRIVFKMSKL